MLCNQHHPVCTFMLHAHYLHQRSLEINPYSSGIVFVFIPTWWHFRLSTAYCGMVVLIQRFFEQQNHHWREHSNGSRL